MENTWLHNLGKFDYDPLSRYIESFYWALGTFLLIGSKGDTFAEQFYCLFILLCTIGLFGYILSTIGQIVDDLNEKNRTLKKGNHYV